MYLSRVKIDVNNRIKVKDLNHLGAYHKWVEITSQVSRSGLPFAQALEDRSTGNDCCTGTQQKNRIWKNWRSMGSKAARKRRTILRFWTSCRAGDKRVSGWC